MLPSPAFIIAMLIAISVHEWAHGFVAYLLGDPTAKEDGRLTLNPLAHLDLMGTLMFLFVGFGWAKPVPVNPNNFHGNVKRGMTLTALAGPASNLLLAFLTLFIGLAISVLGISLSPALAAFFSDFFHTMLWLNLGLMAFNLLPIAPLDGSNILAMFIPYRHQETYESYLRNGPMLLLLLLIAEQVLRIPILVGWISFIARPILAIMEKLLNFAP
jgi:Zn-dependent protease